MRFQVSPVFLGRWTLKYDTKSRKNDDTIDRGERERNDYQILHSDITSR